jgi:AraC family transcriptional regulator
MFVAPSPSTVVASAVVGRSADDRKHAKGGLAPWHLREVTHYIEQHLAESDALATLAARVGLNPFQAIAGTAAAPLSQPLPPGTGQAPVGRTGDLDNRNRHVIGYSETSSFTTAFHKATELTPTACRRHLLGHSGARASTP